MCSTHSITTVMGIKSNLSKWPQLLLIIFWRHSKTKEKKKKPQTSSRTAKFAKGQVSSNTGRGLSGSPHEPGSPPQCTRLMAGAVGPMRQGPCRGPLRRRIPSMHVCRTRMKGFVSEQCCPPMARRSAHSLLRWHPLVSNASTGPRPHQKGKRSGVGDNQSVTLSGSGPLIHIPGWLIQLAEPHALSRSVDRATALPSIQVLFPSKVSRLCSSFPC